MGAQAFWVGFAVNVVCFLIVTVLLTVLTGTTDVLLTSRFWVADGIVSILFSALGAWGADFALTRLQKPKMS